MDHIDYLESESIEIIHEAVSQAQRPVMLYSIGKDSSVMLHLTLKAFYPSKIPFSLLHIDTTWKFREMYRYRDRIKNKFDINLAIYTNKDGLKAGINPFKFDSRFYTDVMKTQALRQALDLGKYDVIFGGARRDEEKSRTKERIFSLRSKDHYWDPKKQRPEIWNLYNNKLDRDHSIRVFPLSNWTESDIWLYILKENISVVPLYFAKRRPVIYKNQSLIMIDDERYPIPSDVKIQYKTIRFRSLGCYPLTAAFESSASTLEEILVETINSRNSERHGRFIDIDDEASMEKKKREGYF